MYDYDVLINSVVEKVKGFLEEGRVVFLVPPGSFRGEIVGRLRGLGFEVLVYEDLYRKICEESCGVGGIKPVSRDLLVDGKDLIEYLRSGGKLSEALKCKGRAVVVKSTAESLLLIERIYGKLVEELANEGKNRESVEKEARKIIKERVIVIFPPKLYKKALKNIDKSIRKAAEVNYSGVLENFVEKPRGVSLKLIEAAEKKGLNHVQSGVRALRALEPGIIRLSDVIKDAAKAAQMSLITAPIIATTFSVGGAAIASIITVVAELFKLDNRTQVRNALSEYFGRYIVSQNIEMLKKEPLKEFLSKLFEGLTKKGKPRNDTLNALLQLIKVAVESREYLEDEDFETVIDEVAYKWGLDTEVFRTFVDNLSRLTTGSITTEKDIDEWWKKHREEIEKRLDSLEEEIRRVREELQVVSVSPDFTFFDADNWRYVKYSDGAVKLEVSLSPEAEYVHTPVEDMLLSKLYEAARSGGGMIVLRGEKGIGKSTAAVVALWRILKQGMLIVEDQQRMKAYRPVVTELYVGSEDEKGLLNKLRLFTNNAKNKEFLPILYVDPSKAGGYTQEIYDPEDFAKSLRSTIEILKNVSKDAVVLIVLSNDQYKSVENLLKDASPIDADEVLEERKVEFLSDIVKKYSGCINKISQELAKIIALWFRDNYVLVAALATDILKRSVCKVEDIEKIVEEAKGRVHSFILDYIWCGLLGEDEDAARRHAPLIIATGLLGLHPPIWGEAIVKAFGGEPLSNIVEWLTQPLHGTILDTINKIAESAAKRAFDMSGVKDICSSDSKGACRLVEICAQQLQVAIPVRKYAGIEEVAEKYVERVAEALLQPQDCGGRKVRAIDYLIKEFVRRFSGEEVDGKWKIAHKIQTSRGEKVLECTYDEIDILSAMFTLAKLRNSLKWFIEGKKLEELFTGSRFIIYGLPFAGEESIATMYLTKLFRVKNLKLPKVKSILDDIWTRKYITDLDVLRVYTILSRDEPPVSKYEAEDILRLFTILVRKEKFEDLYTRLIPKLWRIWHLISDMNNNVVGGPADQLAIVLYNYSVLTKNIIFSIDSFLRIIFAKGDPYLEYIPLPQYFKEFYNATTNLGKLALLDWLLELLESPESILISVLLGKPVLESDKLKLCHTITSKINDFVNCLKEPEKYLATAVLYAGIARCYSSLCEFESAKTYSKKSLEALEKIDKLSVESVDKVKQLSHYLEIWFLKPDPVDELNLFQQLVYDRISQAYFIMGELDKALQYAQKACEIAEKLGEVKHMMIPCSLKLRIISIKEGKPNTEGFKNC